MRVDRAAHAGDGVACPEDDEPRSRRGPRGSGGEPCPIAWRPYDVHAGAQVVDQPGHAGVGGAAVEDSADTDAGTRCGYPGLQRDRRFSGQGDLPGRERHRRRRRRNGRRGDWRRARNHHKHCRDRDDVPHHTNLTSMGHPEFRTKTLLSRPGLSRWRKGARSARVPGRSPTRRLAHAGGRQLTPRVRNGRETRPQGSRKANSCTRLTCGVTERPKGSARAVSSSVTNLPGQGPRRYSPLHIDPLVDGARTISVRRSHAR